VRTNPDAASTEANEVSEERGSRELRSLVISKERVALFRRQQGAGVLTAEGFQRVSESPRPIYHLDTRTVQ
jgi:hypothetical protein